jgi:Tol biopolymer transport system component/DNA-binding winged helix-turn-helix (wHTH) protein
MRFVGVLNLSGRFCRKMTPSAQAYRFNGFLVDPVRRLLFGADGQPVSLKPKVFDTLLYLVARPGVVVDKQALLEAVWPHVVVEENNLSKAISTLRQLFGETRDEHRFIVTEPGRGYRFVASVEAVPAGTTERDTAPETLARVLESQLDYATLHSETPAKAREALAALGAEPTSSVTHPPPVITLRRTAAALALIALVSFAAIGVWSLTDHRTPPVTPAVVRFSISSTGMRFTAAVGVEHVALSADGSRFAHSLGDRILIRGLREQKPISIEVTNAASPSFSPDGEWLAFLSGGLKKVPSAGGTVVEVAASTDRPAGATWGPDGTIVFATTAGLYAVDEGGGMPRLLAKADLAHGELQYAWPRFLPDGRSVLFTIVRDGSIDRAQIAWLDLRTLATEVLLTGGASARYVPTGHLVYGAAQTLMAVPFDLDTRTTLGEPVALRDIAIATATDNGAADFALSENGTLAYVAPRAASPLPRTLVWVDRQGNEEPLTLEPGRYVYARVSPDGTRIAIDVAGSNRDIWIWDLGRETLTRLTDGPNEDMTPLWSPDGRRVFFGSNRTGNVDVYSQPADGSTQAIVELAHPTVQFPSSFTPDGTQLVVTEEYRDVSVLDLTHDELRPLLQRDANDWLGEISPDGRWIAYESDESGVQFEIYVRPFPDVTGQREQVTIDGGRYPRWGPSGSNELYYVALDGAMMAVPIELTPALRVGRAMKLFDFELPQRTISARSYDVSEVDGRFLLVKFLSQTATETIDASVVLNWFEELREQAR